MLMVVIALIAGNTYPTVAQVTKTPQEEDYYKIITIPAPEGVLLEAGGVATLPDGRIAVSTRRGDVWVIENASGTSPRFTLFASGLHEALGLAYKEDALYVAQRGELTKLMDKNGDGVIEVDAWRAFTYAWGIHDAPEEHFSWLDIDHDGKITYAEFSSLLYVWALSEDSTETGNLLFGSFNFV